jgi:hypothetical protein
VRLQPESVGVLGIFDAQVRPVEVSAEGPGDQTSDGGRLEGLGDRPAHRVRGDVGLIKIGAGDVVEFALARNAAKVGGRERQVGQFVGHVVRKHIGDDPVLKRFAKNTAT